MSSSHTRIRNVRRAALFFVPLYLVVAFGLHFSGFTQSVGKNSSASTASGLPSSENPVERESAIISRIIDGDTVEVFVDGATERVRLIGIDTPEEADPRKPVECFSREAAAEMEMLLPQGMLVNLLPDPTQANRDKYGRLLRYVMAPDGADIGHILLARGLAWEYSYKFPYKRETGYREAEKQAESGGKGLWQKDACLGISQGFPLRNRPDA